MKDPSGPGSHSPAPPGDAHPSALPGGERGDAAGGAARKGVNHALLLSYDGGPFCGWQVQAEGETVQGALERAIGTAVRAPARVIGSGRTDAGVHASNQVANVFLPGPVEPHRFRASLNGLAGPHIAVKEVVPVPPDFHARHRARGKDYQYRIYNHPYPPVFSRGRCWWLKRPLALDAMADAAAHLLGRHDFSAFRARHCEAPHPERTLRRLELSRTGGEEPLIVIDLEADAFLQHMARIITGTLVAVGGGKLAPGDLPGILAAGKRELAAATAPAAGLHLMRVHYDLEHYPQLRAFRQD